MMSARLLELKSERNSGVKTMTGAAVSLRLEFNRLPDVVLPAGSLRQRWPKPRRRKLHGRVGGRCA